jgi:hypothetical protein
MNKYFVPIIAGLLGFFVITVSPAYAQASRTWVSGVGDDVNPCSRTAPCKTYAGAISKTASGGEINCLDPAGYGAVTIIKSISISCEYTLGGVLAAGSNGFIVNAPAGSIVTLRGQEVECFGTGINGMEMINVGVTLHIQKATIRNCRGANGILIAPSSGAAKVTISDSTISDSGAAAANAGILIRPTGGAACNIVISNTEVSASTNGIVADGSGGAGNCNVNVRNSVIAENTGNGVAIQSSSGNFTGLVSGSQISSNAGTGALVNGTTSTLRVGGSTISNNVVGAAQTSGVLQSFKNNIVAANGTDGTPMTAFPGAGGTPLQ